MPPVQGSVTRRSLTHLAGRKLMKPNNFQVAVVLASVVLVIAIIAGLVFVGKDPAAVTYLILALLPATISALIGVRASVQAKKSVEELKDEMHEETPSAPRHLDDRR